MESRPEQRACTRHSKSGCAATCATTSKMVQVLVRPFLRTFVRKVDGGLALSIAR